jgi:hypothetical protein
MQPRIRIKCKRIQNTVYLNGGNNSDPKHQQIAWKEQIFALAQNCKDER